MKIFTIQNGMDVAVDDDDFTAVSQVHWKAQPNNRHYLIGSVKGKAVILHRWLMNAPAGLTVDHINEANRTFATPRPRQ